MPTTRKIRCEDTYPDEHKTLVRWFEVAGTGYRKEKALKFASCQNHWLSMKFNPINKHDSNAIEVYGHGVYGFIFKRQRKFHVGYIPSEIAAEIADHQALSSLALHLNQIDVWQGDYNPEKRVYIRASLSVRAQAFWKSDLLVNWERLRK